ncbi:MAG TPA: hypothetical protein VKA94_05100 [Hyphomicrobiales bacterium]|nr:hypothetical protein [Hyphomicrobiales bacterium]
MTGFTALHFQLLRKTGLLDSLQTRPSTVSTGIMQHATPSLWTTLVLTVSGAVLVILLFRTIAAKTSKDAALYIAYSIAISIFVFIIINISGLGPTPEELEKEQSVREYLYRIPNPAKPEPNGLRYNHARRDGFGEGEQWQKVLLDVMTIVSPGFFPVTTGSSSRAHCPASAMRKA